ncbi:MAG: helix-turn-helix domain-containing protein [Rhodobacteraceae bacterium]|nr:helix-turn-helix domain-containing protein [Paracoccaceae bacterium]
MKTIMRMRGLELLTEQQVLTAHKFKLNPNRFNLAPTLFRVLRDAIILDTPLEQMERVRGWPARSAKAIISVLLFAIEETEGMFWTAPGEPAVEDQVEKLAETLEYVTGKDVGERAEVMHRWHLTPGQAQLFLILKRANGAVLSAETIHNRLYHNRIDDPPQIKIINVFICKIRQRLAGSPFRIITIRDTGYRLVEEGAVEGRV